MNRDFRRCLRAYRAIYKYCEGRLSIACCVRGAHRGVAITYCLLGTSIPKITGGSQRLEDDPLPFMANLLARVEEDAGHHALQVLYLEEAALKILTETRDAIRRETHAIN